MGSIGAIIVLSQISLILGMRLIRKWEDFLPNYQYRIVMEAGKNLRDEALAPYPRTYHAVKTHRS